MKRSVAEGAVGWCRLISNLDHKVSDDDIKELFEGMGKVKRAGIIWDNRYPFPLVMSLSKVSNEDLQQSSVGMYALLSLGLASSECS